MSKYLSSQAILVAAMYLLAACSSTVGDLQDMGDRNYMRYAMGKPYQEVASLNPMTLEGLGGATAYGPIVGAYRLEDGNRVFRHAANVESSQSTVDFGVVMQRRNVATRYRLAYFRVGPDGIVNDWAVGALPGERAGCISYVGGIFQRCSTDAEIIQSLAVYDSLVRTSDGRPLSAWGANVEELNVDRGPMMTSAQ